MCYYTTYLYLCSHKDVRVEADSAFCQAAQLCDMGTNNSQYLSTGIYCKSCSASGLGDTGASPEASRSAPVKSTPRKPVKGSTSVTIDNKLSGSTYQRTTVDLHGTEPGRPKRPIQKDPTSSGSGLPQIQHAASHHGRMSSVHVRAPHRTSRRSKACQDSIPSGQGGEGSHQNKACLGSIFSGRGGATLGNTSSGKCGNRLQEPENQPSGSSRYEHLQSQSRDSRPVGSSRYEHQPGDRRPRSSSRHEHPPSYQPQDRQPSGSSRHKNSQSRASKPNEGPGGEHSHTRQAPPSLNPASLLLDPYVVLGIPSDADEASIKKAYRKLLLTCHPDKVTDEAKKPSALARFHEVQVAYELLSDSKRR